MNKEQLANQRGEISVVAELITPDIAQAYLATNSGNQRKLKQKTVLLYESLMRRGRWRMVDCLAFDLNGSLVQGQHRLEALKRAGVSCWFWVQRGLTPSDVAALDRGAVRTVKDVASFQGIELSDRANAALSMMFALHPRRDWLLRRLAPEDRIEIYLEHYQAFDLVSSSNLMHRAVRAVICRAYCAGEDEELLRRFIKLLTTIGPFNPSESAAVLLREKYSRLQKAGRTSGSDVFALELFYMTQYCLGKFLEGYPIKSVQQAKKNLFPVPYFDDFDLED